jgi:hypothetical protein
MSVCAACGGPIETEAWLCSTCTQRHWEGPMAGQEGRLPAQLKADRAEDQVIRRLRGQGRPPTW